MAEACLRFMHIPKQPDQSLQHLVLSWDDAILRSQLSFRSNENREGDAFYESSAMVVQVSARSIASACAYFLGAIGGQVLQVL